MWSLHEMCFQSFMAARTFAPRSVMKTAFDGSMLNSARMALTTCFMFAAVWRKSGSNCCDHSLHKLPFSCNIMDRHSDVADLLVRLCPHVCRYTSTPFVQTILYLGHHRLLLDFRCHVRYFTRDSSWMGQHIFCRHLTIFHSQCY